MNEERKTAGEVLGQMLYLYAVEGTEPDSDEFGLSMEEARRAISTLRKSAQEHVLQRINADMFKGGLIAAADLRTYINEYINIVREQND